MTGHPVHLKQPPYRLTETHNHLIRFYTQAKLLLALASFQTQHFLMSYEHLQLPHTVKSTSEMLAHNSLGTLPPLRLMPCHLVISSGSTKIDSSQFVDTQETSGFISVGNSACLQLLSSLMVKLIFSFATT